MDDRKLTSEESIIQGYLAPLAAGHAGALGLKDDCAVVAPSAGCEFVLKTDAIAESVHFFSDDRPADIGWKALAVNVSDLAAKGARPVGYLMSLSFPAAPTRQWMADFAAGLGEAQSAFGMHLLGGDTDRRPGPISITPTVIGEVETGRAVRRTTARAGDVAYVSGTIGDARLGLMLRQRPELAVRWGLAPHDAEVLTARFLRPAPRLALVAALRSSARAAMDVSDGLAKDLDRMCRASAVAATIDAVRLPLSPAFRIVRERDPDAASAALFAGDDYEILAAVPPDAAGAFEAAAVSSGLLVTAVGRFREHVRDEAAVVLRDENGSEAPLAPIGWDHF
jgi:thiamine-monophosphate kinase